MSQVGWGGSLLSVVQFFAAEIDDRGSRMMFLGKPSHAYAAGVRRHGAGLSKGLRKEAGRGAVPDHVGGEWIFFGFVLGEM